MPARVARVVLPVVAAITTSKARECHRLPRLSKRSHGGIHHLDRRKAPGTQRLESIAGTRGRIVLVIKDKLQFPPERSLDDRVQQEIPRWLFSSRRQYLMVESPLKMLQSYATLMQNFVDAILDGAP